MKIKKIFRIPKILFVFLSLMLWNTSSSATVMTYGDESSYISSVGGEIFFNDFSGGPGGYTNGSLIDPTNALFSSPDASDPSLVNWQTYIGDAGSTTGNGVGSLQIDFISTVIYGFSFVSLSSGEQQTIELYDDSATMLGSVLSPSNSGFFGFTSDIAISMVKILPGEYAPGSYDRFFIDDLRANGVSVPEPSLLALMGVGLAGMFMVRRKNKKI